MNRTVQIMAVMLFLVGTASGEVKITPIPPSSPPVSTSPTKTAKPEPRKPANDSAAATQPATLDGFWGMKFGSSMDDCKKVMKEKGCEPEPDSPAENALVFKKGIKFADREASIGLIFDNGKLQLGCVLLRSETRSAAIQTLKTVSEELTSKYGKGDRLDRATAGTEGLGWRVKGVTIVLSIDETRPDYLIKVIYSDESAVEAKGKGN